MRTCWRGCTGWCLSSAAACAVPAIAAAAVDADVAAVAAAVAAVAAAVGRLAVHNSCSYSQCSWSTRHCLVEGWIATRGEEAGS